MEAVKEIKLSFIDRQIYETPQEIFNFLKKNYGVPGTENMGVFENIFATQQISIPELPKGSAADIQTTWQVHLEKMDAENGTESISLIFGVSGLNKSNIWSRLIEIQSSIHTEHFGSKRTYARCRYLIIASNLFEIGDQTEKTFKSVTAFMAVMKKYLEQNM